MNPNIHYEFYRICNMDSKTAEMIVRQFPPSETQTELCNTLEISPLLWSIFESRKETIMRIAIAAENTNKKKYYNLFKNQIRERHINTTENEFVLCLDEMIRLQQKHYYVICYPSSLQDACISKIFQSLRNKDRSEIQAFLPKWILSRLEDVESLSQDFREPLYDDFFLSHLPLFEASEESQALSQNDSPPKYNSSELIQFCDGKFSYEYKFFSQIDASTFSKDYVEWFSQKARPILFSSKLLKVVYLYVRNGFRYHLCLKCMKRRLAVLYGEKYGMFERCFYNTGEGPFYLNEYRNHWCAECKSVPLFQLLTPKDYNMLYNGQKKTERKHYYFPIKVERFI